METFTLVVFLWLQPGEAWSWDYREARTLGLSQDECMAAAKLVTKPQGGARCVVEGRPEPTWTPPASLELSGSIYVGGGRHESIRAKGLSESVCRTSAAEVNQAGGHAHCAPPRSSCPDCSTIRNLIKSEGRAPS
jgi:hypothetical protein